MAKTPKDIFIAKRVKLLKGRNKEARASAEWDELKRSQKRKYEHLALLDNWDEDGYSCPFFYDGTEMIYNAEERSMAYIKDKAPAFAMNPIPRFVIETNLYMDAFKALDKLRRVHKDAFITVDTPQSDQPVRFHFPTTCPSLEEMYKCFDDTYLEDNSIEEWTQTKEDEKQKNDQDARDDYHIKTLIEELVKTTDRATIIAKLNELRRTNKDK